MSQLRVMITGGGRGIGRATALRFARAGAKVVVAARTSSQLDAWWPRSGPWRRRAWRRR
jgi:NAD(P)-dependent dehydrogenase (short-subunit alcohol dehydrogenase family)